MATRRIGLDVSVDKRWMTELALWQIEYTTVAERIKTLAATPYSRQLRQRIFI
jgi:hypothetical protein